MLSLAVISGILLLVVIFVPVSVSVLTLIDRIDIIIACTFLVEFIVRFLFAEKKFYFFQTSWWELLAAIPVTNELTQALRLLRFLRIGRLLLHLELINKKRSLK